jgi:hypothetical protein
VPLPSKVPLCALVGTNSIHRELEKVKFPEFMDAMYVSATEEWLENMATCFTLRDYTSNMKLCIVVFQLKGSTLLWWKMVLPQLNMVVSRTCHGNCSRRGSGRSICERNSLSHNSMSSKPYDKEVVRCPSIRPDSWRCLGMLHM